MPVPLALFNRRMDRCGERGRTDGAFMGWWNLATKLNLALAAGLSLPLLALWGYVPGRQDADAVLALGLAYGLLPCVLLLNQSDGADELTRGGFVSGVGC